MPQYRIALRQEQTYVLPGSCLAEAKIDALAAFRKEKPIIIEAERICPCQVDGKCPYPASHKCSECEGG